MEFSSLHLVYHGFNELNTVRDSETTGVRNRMKSSVYAYINILIKTYSSRFNLLMSAFLATPSSILAWEIPWTEEPGSLHSIGSQRVGDD